MATEAEVQGFVHALEEGRWASRVRMVLLLAGIAVIFCIFILGRFHGLDHPVAMDQAQIARELAAGHGFSTKFIRPAQVWQFGSHGKSLRAANTPDVFHAPLNPLLESVALRFTKDTWEMTPKQYAANGYVYPSDRVIASVAMLCFLASVGVNFLIAKRLFDRRLAVIGMGLTLVAELFWRFSMSGLPQMLMLLVFSVCTYLLVRAFEARQEARNPALWLAAAGAAFGLLALTHALTIWIFGSAMFFVMFAFWPRQTGGWRAFFTHPGWLMLGLFTLCYAPWLVRTWMICGSPMGLSFYTFLAGLRGNENTIMRGLSGMNVADLTPLFVRTKLLREMIAGLAGLFGSLGHSVIAPAFFLALLHFFKSPVTALFRWCLLLMWGGALVGMSIFAAGAEEELSAGDLHVLFIPLFTFYGLAFVLVLWSRLTADKPALNAPIIRFGFFSAFFLLSSLPLLNVLLFPTLSRVQWPPYIPPYIAILNGWTNEDEIIASDMPWAVAWYANRKSIWVPLTIRDFLTLHDYGDMGGSVVGLYLTPISGNQRFISGIIKGEYKEWAPFIMRNVNTRDFPLRAQTALPIDNECIFYADHDRWSERTD